MFLFFPDCCNKKDYFAKNDIDIKFIKPLSIEYHQLKNTFIPWLSIIDILMFNHSYEIRGMLNHFELI